MNNIPAFPTGIITDGKGKIIGGSNGMNLRDYFAAHAMQAMTHRGESNVQMVSIQAYALADQMIKAREL